MKSVVPFLVCILMTASCSTTRPTNEWQTISSAPNAKVNAEPVPAADAKESGFLQNLPAGFSQPTDDVGRRMLKEYGAMFVAGDGVVPPSVVVFRDEGEVAAFQKSVESTTETIGGVTIELQEPAMRALKAAISEGATITPRGSDAAKRNFAGTVTNWASRVEPGLRHWVANARITEQDAQRIRALSPPAQVPEIFKLEERGIFFAANLSKSIIYSVAPPGTSQHLSMLALDVTEHADSRVRDILAKHGWHQTVISDLPHFTYLGVTQTELPGLGLKKVTDGGRSFWVPDI